MMGPAKKQGKLATGTQELALKRIEVTKFTPPPTGDMGTPTRIQRAQVRADDDPLVSCPDTDDCTSRANGPLIRSQGKLVPFWT